MSHDMSCLFEATPKMYKGMMKRVRDATLRRMDIGDLPIYVGEGRVCLDAVRHLGASHLGPLGY